MPRRAESTSHLFPGGSLRERTDGAGTTQSKVGSGQAYGQVTWHGIQVFLSISMSKRSATEIVDPAIQNGRRNQKSAGATAEEMGEFEDAWEDEIESDDGEVIDAEANEQEDGVSITNPIHKLAKILSRNGC